MTCAIATIVLWALCAAAPFFARREPDDTWNGGKVGRIRERDLQD